MMYLDDLTEKYTHMFLLGWGNCSFTLKKCNKHMSITILLKEILNKILCGPFKNVYDISWLAYNYFRVGSSELLFLKLQALHMIYQDIFKTEKLLEIAIFCGMAERGSAFQKEKNVKYTTAYAETNLWLLATI